MSEKRSEWMKRTAAMCAEAIGVEESHAPEATEEIFKVIKLAPNLADAEPEGRK